MENGFRNKQNSATYIRLEFSFDLIMPCSARFTSNGSKTYEDYDKRSQRLHT